MNDKQIRALIDQLAKYDFIHAQIKIDDFELSLDRDQLASGSNQTVEQAVKTINSPMIGVFHANEQPMKVGTLVTDNTVVGQIESMKLFNDVTASITGKVVAILCDDGEAVQFDQPLFKVAQGVAD
ncbi:acetyl-CoA carboxylase biotin carboxyl carrier protein [Paucilactobacillus kaifaensis]|uniref:acetyl-CoA carboxylase biotin carboxyl carrier protein n=1 Tax=Paucilactobacillus kaifaensis TaxID=2559921 RepID=UPI0010F5A8FD|nr:biotin/lipoyl-containing protein [Paucilactobacillus kaifaensis]